MQTTTCKKCNHAISRNAEACPQCKTPTHTSPEVYANCRICGERILRNKHRALCSAIGRRSSDRMGILSHIRHRACPNCGEPEPLQCFWDTAIAGLMVFFIVFAGGLVSFLCFMVLAGFSSSYTGNMDARLMHRVFAASFMVLYLILIWLINRWRSAGIPSVKAGYITLAVIVILVGAIDYF